MLERRRRMAVKDKQARIKFGDTTAEKISKVKKISP
jgi:hypothetical protein